MLSELTTLFDKVGLIVERFALLAGGTVTVAVFVLGIIGTLLAAASLGWQEFC